MATMQPNESEFARTTPAQELSEPSKRSPPEQFHALTGLRGFAALWVVSFHFMDITKLLLPASKHLDWLFRTGSSGVPLFFILSGFVLIHTYRDKFTTFTWREYFNFIGLRLARIYPAYLAALATLVLLVLLAALTGKPYTAKAYPWPLLPFEALMLHQWLPTGFLGWNFPDWSVSAEWFAYLFVFPIAIWLLKRLAPVRPIIIMALIVALCALEPAVRTRWSLSMVSLLFLAGALLCDLRQRLMPDIPRHLDLVAAVLFFFGLRFAPEFANHFPSVFLVVIGVLILGLSGANGLVSRLLATRLAVFLGVISYSIYLSHGIVQRFLKIALPAAQFADAPLYVRAGIWLAYLATILLAAIALYYAVEHPARLWLRRRFARRERRVEARQEARILCSPNSTTRLEK